MPSLRTTGCALAAVLAAGAAHAQGNAPVEGPSLVPMLLAFALVLALIPLAMWLLKRFGAAHPAAQGAGLKVVAQLALGPRERIVVVEAGERWLMLGVTAAAINRIGTLPKGQLPAAGTPGFAALLARAGK
jgi:flagellar protein FliO/FliZ